MRSRETDVEVFGGEVESLSIAEVEGVGVRVIADHRQGYAWAGSLDADVIAETLRRGARQRRVRRARRVVRARRRPPTSTASTPPTLDLWRDELLAVPTDEKVALALELEAATKARRPAHPQRRVGVATATPRSKPRSRTRSASRRRPGARCARARRSRWPTTAPARRPATASRPGARFADLDLERRGRATPPSAPSACSARSRSRRRASR